MKGVYERSAETKRKLSESLIGNQNSKGHKVSDELKGIIRNMRTGSTWSPEIKVKISESMKGNQNARKVKKE